MEHQKLWIRWRRINAHSGHLTTHLTIKGYTNGK
jgi:hypothetical protein